MTTDFVIVIEADNRRAHAAYLKGLADLDLIWPQLMAHAESVDTPRNARITAARDDAQRQIDKYHADMAAYSESMEKWSRSSPMFRGPAPAYLGTPDLYALRMSMHGTPNMQRRRYESIRNELKHMADVAGAAMGPFRMTEHQVREMVRWEDGSKIESMKRTMQRSAPEE